MKKILATGLIMGSTVVLLQAAPQVAEIKLKDLTLDRLGAEKNQISLVARFDVKRERLMDEVVFDFYLMLFPNGKGMEPQFLHCRTVHRYLEEKTGHKSGVVLPPLAVKAINSRDEIYAVVVTYKGKEVGVENSEDTRWWEASALGAPVENMLTRSSSLPIVREWESGQ